jgi:hypothetical protein
MMGRSAKSRGGIAHRSVRWGRPVATILDHLVLQSEFRLRNSGSSKFRLQAATSRRSLPPPPRPEGGLPVRAFYARAAASTVALCLS